MTPHKAKVEAAFDLMLNGMTLRKALSTIGFSAQTFRKALEQDRELAVSYVRVRELMGDLALDDIIEISRTEPDVQRAKLITDNMKWKATKDNPRYNDRIDINVQQTISISEAMTQAQTFTLRSMGDLLPVQDAQTIDAPSLPAPEPTDNQSVPTAAPPVPDIFS